MDTGREGDLALIPGVCEVSHLSKVLGNRQALLQAVRAAGEGWGPQGASPLQARVPFLGRRAVSQEPVSPLPLGHWLLAVSLTLYIRRLCTPFKLLLAYGGANRELDLR